MIVGISETPNKTITSRLDNPICSTEGINSDFLNHPSFFSISIVSGGSGSGSEVTFVGLDEMGWNVELQIVCCDSG